MEDSIDIERAKIDFEYFYNNVLITEDEDGNRVKMPPLKDYQKGFYKWLMDCHKNGVKAFYLHYPTRFELYNKR